MAQPGRQQQIPRNARRVPVPAVALDRWLAEIDDLGELKVALRVLALSGSESIRGDTPPSVSLGDLVDDAVLRSTAHLDSDASIRNGLARSIRRGILVAARVGGDTRIWLKDERAEEYLAKDGFAVLAPSEISGLPSNPEERPETATRASAKETRANIFVLYEQHFGTFGHGIAEQLRAAEEEYPVSWIAEAFGIASAQNVRSWGYVHAILRRWLNEGKPGVSAGAKGAERERRHDDGEPGHDPAADSRTGYLESYRRRYGRLPWESDDLSDRHGD